MRKSTDKVSEVIKVFVRVRPPISNEVDEAVAVNVTGVNSVQVKSDRYDVTCHYDHVFNEIAEQESVFEKIQPLLDDVLSGYNGCIFAYGQTSAGKTYTMLGPDGGRETLELRTKWGIIPRSAHYIFGLLQSKVKTGNFSFHAKASFLQIYNEHLYDLLSDAVPMDKRYTDDDNRDKDVGLKIREIPAKNTDNNNNNNQCQEVYVNGLSEFRVQTVDDVFRVITAGSANRTTRATDFNASSSRSHAILQLTFEIDSVDDYGSKILYRSKLSLVDLAGSEKMQSMASDPTTKHLRELTSINLSLSCLGNVIAALTNPHRIHIPYRDSKLTRLLQDSLGGNTRTILVACVAPLTEQAAESISTLQFADRAKKVMIRAKANTVVDDKALLAQAQTEISRLKLLLKHALGKVELGLGKSLMEDGETGDEMQRLLQDNDRLRGEVDALKVELMNSNRKAKSKGGKSKGNKTKGLISHRSSGLVSRLLAQVQPVGIYGVDRMTSAHVTGSESGVDRGLDYSHGLGSRSSPGTNRMGTGPDSQGMRRPPWNDRLVEGSVEDSGSVNGSVGGGGNRKQSSSKGRNLPVNDLYKKPPLSVSQSQSQSQQQQQLRQSRSSHTNSDTPEYDEDDDAHTGDGDDGSMESTGDGYGGYESRVPARDDEQLDLQYLRQKLKKSRDNEQLRKVEETLLVASERNFQEQRREEAALLKKQAAREALEWQLQQLLKQEQQSNSPAAPFSPPMPPKDKKKTEQPPINVNTASNNFVNTKDAKGQDISSSSSTLSPKKGMVMMGLMAGSGSGSKTGTGTGTGLESPGPGKRKSIVSFTSEQPKVPTTTASATVASISAATSTSNNKTYVSSTSSPVPVLTKPEPAAVDSTKAVNTPATVTATVTATATAAAAPEKRPESSAGLLYSEVDVDRTIQIFSFRLNSWDTVKLTDFEASRGMHKCLFANGTSQWLNLKQKPIRSFVAEQSNRLVTASAAKP